MVNDPYSVLGISRDATPEEIKKAYRTQAKKYHPDLHPNDPVAAKKMNEVNEAYDMLTNPEKYARQRATQGGPGNRYSNAGSYTSQNQYGNYGYGQSGNRGQYGGSGGYGGQNQSSGYGNQSGPGGWSTSYWGFDFEDLFGFGQARHMDTTPKPQNGDTVELVKAITFVNSGRFEEALGVLSRMTSVYRNARWYYVSAIAYYGLRDYESATEMIQRAIKLDPNNQVYQQLYRQYQATNRSQYTSQYGYGSSSRGGFGLVGKLLIGFFIFQFVMSILRILFYGLLF